MSSHESGRKVHGKGDGEGEVMTARLQFTLLLTVSNQVQFNVEVVLMVVIANSSAVLP